MLNVFCYRSINILFRSPVVCKWRICVIVYSSKAHGSAISDIFVYTLDSQNFFKLTIRNKGCMQHNASVVKLFFLGKSKAKWIRSGKNNLHSTACIDIWENSCSFNEILHKGNFVYEYIFVTVFFQQSQVGIHIRQSIPKFYLNESGLFKFYTGHFCKNLTNHCSLAGSSETIEDKHFISAGTKNIFPELTYTFSLFIFSCNGNLSSKLFSGSHCSFEIQAQMLFSIIHLEQNYLSF